MPDWSTIIGSRIESIGADTANSRGTAVTSGLTNIKGLYVELIASTSFRASSIVLYIASGSGGTFLIDVSIGSLGSEQVIIENLVYSSAKVPGDAAVVEIPVAIPEGSRISARCQKSGTTGAAYICGAIIGNPFLASSGLGRVTTYGANTGDSGGVAIDPGATANTKGGWIEVTSSTTNNIRQMIIGIGSAGNAALSTGTFLLDIAIGASGSEQVIAENLQISSHLANDRFMPSFFQIGYYIPAGTRLAVQAQSTITDATDRLFDVVIYGVD